ncbi:DNA topoisomerase III [Macroventuria anomochaeta]|uniref:DNA topoisomerase III n=1 Tax=Macroventuria anomochaeta TaxID=301207 RepID=A0ACB6RHK7_9PLEO|nr:DNA topoisomerase III [Macroventuria anomochaeta]KAF2621244.1 DNA topoisomerase III [Macroventuria anomochaeta]
MKVLCVAEKPSIAKAVANHLGGRVTTDSVRGIQWVKNYKFDFRFQQWGQCDVTFTCVAGHIVGHDFTERYRKWHSCPPADLFDAPIQSFIAEDKKAVASNIESQARGSQILFIWTDCDREGENIGTEIRDIALKVNPRLRIFRARFSNIERAHVIQASQNPIQLDEAQSNAVAARTELDLRLGAAFTRMQTLALQSMIPVRGDERGKMISYGSCQFPTLGFVVDRYLRVHNFVPEPFWYIKVHHTKDDVEVKFNWRRGHLFDRMAVTLIFEKCLISKTAKVIKMAKKPTKKWKPLPLTTVELQKMGSRFLHMSSQDVMKVAEELYTKGWISYPRTETDQFDRGMDLRSIVSRQTQDGRWGNFAQNLMNGGFNQPRNGRNNDKAHPPIHPVNYVASNALNSENERKVYEFVVRRFLACCSEDAVGEATDIEIDYGAEIFHAHGLRVIARNYLDVYPYDKWESSQQLPHYTVGETFEPTEVNMLDGKTSAPTYLTEPELIALMDVNGIGTDATMAEHIAKIQEREYVIARPKGGAAGNAGNGAGRGRGRGRGRGGARGGRGGAAAGHNGGGGAAAGGVQEFIPTTLGVALIEGYDNVGIETSLSKPFLRKEMELQMKAICEGRTTRNDVVQQNLDQYRAIFNRTVQQINVLKSAITKYVVQANHG